MKTYCSCISHLNNYTMEGLSLYLSSSCCYYRISLLWIIFLLCNTRISAVIKLPNNETVPAILVFGDSIVDPGNNNYNLALGKCDFPPYGRDFMGGMPTGRFSNGKIVSDFIVEELGIKEYLPAYLDPSLQLNDLRTGVSFASGGTGYDPLTAKLVSAISPSDQLKLFEEYLSKLKTNYGEETTNFVLAKGLFIVVASSCDIANTYFDFGARKSLDISSYADLVVSSASTFFKDLYKLGARRIGVFSAPPLGCVPSQRSLFGGPERACSQEINQASQLYNAKLSSEIDLLNKNLPDARVVYIDIYGPLLDLIDHPDKYGFAEISRGCCGTGTVEATFLCNKYTLTCPDAASYLFWDSFHPTERAYRILITSVFSKYVNNFL